jgi:hypothetical protein
MIEDLEGDVKTDLTDVGVAPVAGLKTLIGVFGMHDGDFTGD